MKNKIHNDQFQFHLPNGKIIEISDEVLSAFLPITGQQIAYSSLGNASQINLPIDYLNKIYIEPTNRCNLECKTCVRRVWNEALGEMSEKIFEKIFSGVKNFHPIPHVFFGGFGEPLVHPMIVEMVERFKGIGSRVELITNGILLDQTMSKKLIFSGLDRLWVSIDGSTAHKYADIRLRRELPRIINNIRVFRTTSLKQDRSPVELGFAFVAMKRNIADLPEVLRLGQELGVKYYSITNVLAHTPEMKQEILYQDFFNRSVPHRHSPKVSLPRMDFNNLTQETLNKIFMDPCAIDITGNLINAQHDSCPFIRRATTSIRWDGAVSPCLALMHTFTSYLDDRLRTTSAYSIGNVNHNTLEKIWHDPVYRSLRERLQNFDFSPCVYCNSCDMALENKEDCFGNVTPACGGCLWAQGLIQCP